MSTNIIFIEGNPGSGKSTFAKRLESTLLSQGKKVKMYQEGDLHPIDLAWCAILNAVEYQALLDEFPSLKEEILKFTQKIEDQYIIAYTKVNHNIASNAFYERMRAFEIYRSESLSVFQMAHQKLWQAFPFKIEPNTIYIFECVFIQNHINELILKYNLPYEDILAYFNELMAPLIQYHPKVVFIEQADVKKSIMGVADKRRTNDPTRFRDWIDLVIEYIENMPYAKALGYTELEGIIQYFIDRQTLSLKIIDRLNVKVNVIKLEDSYDETFNQLLAVVL